MDQEKIEETIKWMDTELRAWVGTAAFCLKRHVKLIDEMQKKIDLATDLLEKLCGDEHAETLALLKENIEIG